MSQQKKNEENPNATSTQEDRTEHNQTHPPTEIQKIRLWISISIAMLINNLVWVYNLINNPLGFEQYLGFQNQSNPESIDRNQSISSRSNSSTPLNSSYPLKPYHHPVINHTITPATLIGASIIGLILTVAGVLGVAHIGLNLLRHKKLRKNKLEAPLGTSLLPHKTHPNQKTYTEKEVYDLYIKYSPKTPPQAMLPEISYSRCHLIYFRHWRNLKYLIEKFRLRTLTNCFKAWVNSLCLVQITWMITTSMTKKWFWLISALLGSLVFSLAFIYDLNRIQNKKYKIIGSSKKNNVCLCPKKCKSPIQFSGALLKGALAGGTLLTIQTRFTVWLSASLPGSILILICTAIAQSSIMCNNNNSSLFKAILNRCKNHFLLITLIANAFGTYIYARGYWHQCTQLIPSIIRTITESISNTAKTSTAEHRSPFSLSMTISMYLLFGLGILLGALPTLLTVIYTWTEKLNNMVNNLGLSLPAMFRAKKQEELNSIAQQLNVIKNRPEQDDIESPKERLHDETNMKEVIKTIFNIADKKTLSLKTADMIAARQLKK